MSVQPAPQPVTVQPVGGGYGGYGGQQQQQQQQMMGHGGYGGGMMMQQQQQQQTVVNVHGGGGVVRRMPQNIRDWDAGLCGCCDDIGVCCCGWFCTWCLLCDVATDLQENCCCPYWNPPYALAVMRMKTRAMYGIRGGMVMDSCVVCCCFQCATCQLKRQLKRFNAVNVQDFQ